NNKMDKEFLQSFLKTGLFEIGDSDDRLDKLRKSIADLQKNLEEDFSLLPKYTLVAIDPNISDSEPALLETEKIVRSHWETLRSKYPEMPRNILRGVIINAINNVSFNDVVAARIVYLTALDLYPFVKLNKEKEVVETLLIKLGDLAEENAIKEWSFIEEEPSLKIGVLKINDFKFGSSVINNEQLKNEIFQSLANSPQGHGPQHGGQSSWGQSFSEKSSVAIANAFNNAFQDFNKTLSPDSIEGPINKFFSTFKKSLDESLTVAFSSLTAVERRSKLLWWKETLYSSSLRRSYRGLDKNLLPIVMSADLNIQIPEITPISVDYLLRDTIFLLHDKKDDKVKFIEFLTAISKDETKILLKPFFSILNEEEGRISITDFIALLLNDRVSIKDFQNRTGIKDKEEINISEIAVTILHGFLIQRLITE
ncbi:MAG: GTPase-associated system all-helical protein GASH, partial [Paludibacter sp.]